MFWQAPVAVDAHSRASCTLARRALFRSPTAASLGPSYRERSSDGVDAGPAVAAAAGAAGPGASTRSCASVVALPRPVTAPSLSTPSQLLYPGTYTWVPKYLKYLGLVYLGTTGVLYASPQAAGTRGRTRSSR
jgi:hypothetical protein